jgi:hypothetical protein
MFRRIKQWVEACIEVEPLEDLDPDCFDEYGMILSTTLRGLTDYVETFERWQSEDLSVISSYPRLFNGPESALTALRIWRREVSRRQDAYYLHENSRAARDLLGIDPDDLNVPPTPRRRPIPKTLRFDVLHRADYTCQACGAKAADGAELHIDHIHPVSKGGTNDPTNLQALCRDCNLGKGARVL